MHLKCFNNNVVDKQRDLLFNSKIWQLQHDPYLTSTCVQPTVTIRQVFLS